METLDKAVSTEDFSAENRNVYVEATRLEALLNALVEHKVESMKNQKSGMLSIQSGSSPKQLISRLRITSSSSSLKERDNSDNSSSKRLKYSPKKVTEGSHRDPRRQIKKTGEILCFV